jgi:hypothetical protein
MLRLNRFRARSALVPASCTDRTLDIGWKFRPVKIEAIKIWNKYYNWSSSSSLH